MPVNASGGTQTLGRVILRAWAIICSLAWVAEYPQKMR
jgi:hypothetical protein